jgi:hypothetical protein
MMKMNKWTMALAAAGVVSLSSVAQAQEAAAGADALAASTTLTGYVSSSYTMDGTTNDGSAGSTNPQGYWRSGSNISQFTLDVVSLTLASAQGAGEYAAGYTVQLWAGSAAGNINTQDDSAAADASTVELMQANIDLRLPVGNGLDIKVGQMGTVVGAESYDYNANAFFTRSFAFDVEPTHHTGILASYQVSDDASVQLGIANNKTTGLGNGINDRDGSNVLLTSVSYTTPDSLGVLAGTELYYGGVWGASNTATDEESNTHFFSATVPVPVEGLSYTAAVTIVDNSDLTVAQDVNRGDSNITSHYLSYALNDKATLNVRYEHGNLNSGSAPGTASWTDNIDGLESLSVGVDYALWENTTSRIEWRDDSGDGINDQEVIALNIVYNF